MITYNRAEYTRMTLGRLLDTCDEQMRVWVWHNGTDTDTLNAVESLSNHRSFYRLHVSEENKRLREPTNWFWSTSDAEYLSKVDDDCLLPDGWAQTLKAAHGANPTLGIIGCWRFYEEDFVPDLAEKKITSLGGGHQLMRNCWVQGSGYLMKRGCVEEAGLLRDNETFTDYSIRLALGGWQNGWYYPFIHEEHMDDPRSAFCGIKTEHDFQRSKPLSAINDRVRSLAEWAARVQYTARSVQEASPNPLHHTGWRGRVRRIQKRLLRAMGAREPWRTSLAQ